METHGSIVDKLITVDLKMWNNQEALYEIRRMSYDEFKAKYNGTEELYNILKKACDLNVQRNNLINEMDEKTLEMLRVFALLMGIDNGKVNNIIAQMSNTYSIKQHKTY